MRGYEKDFNIEYKAGLYWYARALRKQKTQPRLGFWNSVKRNINVLRTVDAYVLS